MRKIFAGLILGLVLVAGGLARATEPCEGFGNVILIETRLSASLNRVRITTAFSDYTNPSHRSPSGDAIWLCFQQEPNADIGLFTSSLSLNNTSGLPVIISGLNIRGGELLGTNPLLHLRGTSPVTLIHSSLSNCKNCLKISGNNNRAQSTNIQCLNRDLGTGLLLLGRNHEIGGDLNVSDCRTAVQIGSAPIEGNDITVHDSTLNGNGTAIKLIRGRRNFFQANSIYNNDRNNDSIFAGDEGILILNGANGGPAAPEIVPVGEEDAEGLRGGLRYLSESFDCQNLPTEWSATATLQLRMPEPGGNVEISFISDTADQSQETVNWRQGREFFRTANCTAPTANVGSVVDCTFIMDSAHKRRRAVALLQNSSTGSSTFSALFRLNDPCHGTGVISAADLGAPGAGAGPATGGANIEYAAGIGSGSGSPPPSPPPSKKDDNSNNMSGSAGGEPTAAVAGAVTSGGFGGSGASAGCGASLNPTQKFPQGAWHYMGIFSPLAILVGWRVKKKTL